MKRTLSLLFLIIFVACTSQNQEPSPIPKFTSGDVVRHVIYDKRGVILKWACDGRRVCIYTVRFVDNRVSTEERLTFPKPHNAPFCITKGIYEFELIKIGEKE